MKSPQKKTKKKASNRLTSVPTHSRALCRAGRRIARCPTPVSGLATHGAAQSPPSNPDSRDARGGAEPAVQPPSLASRAQSLPRLAR